MKKYDKEKAREYRVRKAAAKGAVSVKKTPTGIVANSAAEYRREYKRLQRRRNGCRTLDEVKAAAKERNGLKADKPQELHDAHVKRRKQIVLWRSQFQRKKDLLLDSYIKKKLKEMGIPTSAITPEINELQRQSIEATRISRSIKRAIKNHWKEENETITKHS